MKKLIRETIIQCPRAYEAFLFRLFDTNQILPTSAVASSIYHPLSPVLTTTQSKQPESKPPESKQLESKQPEAKQQIEREGRREEDNMAPTTGEEKDSKMISSMARIATNFVISAVKNINTISDVSQAHFIPLQPEAFLVGEILSYIPPAIIRRDLSTILERGIDSISFHHRIAYPSASFLGITPIGDIIFRTINLMDEECVVPTVQVFKMVIEYRKKRKKERREKKMNKKFQFDNQLPKNSSSSQTSPNCFEPAFIDFRNAHLNYHRFKKLTRLRQLARNYAFPVNIKVEPISNPSSSTVSSTSKQSISSVTSLCFRPRRLEEEDEEEERRKRSKMRENSCLFRSKTPLSLHSSKNRRNSQYVEKQKQNQYKKGASIRRNMSNVEKHQKLNVIFSLKDDEKINLNTPNVFFNQITGIIDEDVIDKRNARKKRDKERETISFAKHSNEFSLWFSSEDISIILFFYSMFCNIFRHAEILDCLSSDYCHGDSTHLDMLVKGFTIVETQQSQLPDDSEISEFDHDQESFLHSSSSSSSSSSSFETISSSAILSEESQDLDDHKEKEKEEKEEKDGKGKKRIHEKEYMIIYEDGSVSIFRHEENYNCFNNFQETDEDPKKKKKKKKEKQEEIVENQIFRSVKHLLSVRTRKPFVQRYIPINIRITRNMISRYIRDTLYETHSFSYLWQKISDKNHIFFDLNYCSMFCYDLRKSTIFRNQCRDIVRASKCGQIPKILCPQHESIIGDLEYGIYEFLLSFSPENAPSYGSSSSHCSYFDNSENSSSPIYSGFSIFFANANLISISHKMDESWLYSIFAESLIHSFSYLNYCSMFCYDLRKSTIFRNQCRDIVRASKCGQIPKILCPQHESIIGDLEYGIYEFLLSFSPENAPSYGSSSSHCSYFDNSENSSSPIYSGNQCRDIVRASKCGQIPKILCPQHESIIGDLEYGIYEFLLSFSPENAPSYGSSSSHCSYFDNSENSSSPIYSGFSIFFANANLISISHKMDESWLYSIFAESLIHSFSCTFLLTPSFCDRLKVLFEQFIQNEFQLSPSSYSLLSSSPFEHKINPEKIDEHEQESKNEKKDKDAIVCQYQKSHISNQQGPEYCNYLYDYNLSTSSERLVYIIYSFFDDYLCYDEKSTSINRNGEKNKTQKEEGRKREPTERIRYEFSKEEEERYKHAGENVIFDSSKERYQISLVLDRFYGFSHLEFPIKIFKLNLESIVGFKIYDAFESPRSSTTISPKIATSKSPIFRSFSPSSSSSSSSLSEHPELPLDVEDEGKGIGIDDRVEFFDSHILPIQQPHFGSSEVIKRRTKVKKDEGKYHIEPASKSCSSHRKHNHDHRIHRKDDLIEKSAAEKHLHDDQKIAPPLLKKIASFPSEEYFSFEMASEKNQHLFTSKPKQSDHKRESDGKIHESEDESSECDSQ
ncbi:hypothetical protein ADUPG1_013670 [Aduncisulcus paluster]|uniref:Uncharacterized protein n=1 Tax=Aduncisulcus paluster TaxID=2918883 RepID=A0ABQ5K3Q2_9EUKA|nr:hypothetical protein ADUPG1_013670 [Aduncisulcus paluster]